MPRGSECRRPSAEVNREAAWTFETTGYEVRRPLEEIDTEAIEPLENRPPEEADRGN